MPRKPNDAEDLSTLQAERTRLEAMLADILEREKLAREAQRDAGRNELLAALSKVKVGPLSRADAKVIAQAIARHGGSKIVEALSSLG